MTAFRAGAVHNDHVLAEIRAVIKAHGTRILAVSDYTVADLTGTWWAETPADAPVVAALLERAASGDVEYLALRAPKGQAVARGCVNYVEWPGVGSISQLSTKRGLRGLGIGGRLLLGIEDRIVRRGVGAAALAVAAHNHSARRLYERLGYVAVGEREATWSVTNADDSEVWRTKMVTDLRKELS